MIQPDGRQWIGVWTAVSSALASAVPAAVRAEEHLTPEAIVAFVDSELGLPAHERVTRHLAGCPACLAEVAAQRQARAAVRDADGPVMSPALLAALHTIPQRAELPAGPDELAITDDGQLVVAQRPLPRASGSRLGAGQPLGSSAPLGAGQPLGTTGFGRPATGPDETDQPAHGQGDQEAGARRRVGRRARQAGAGVVMSGLVFGAMVLVAPFEPANDGVPGSPRPSTPGGAGPAPAATSPVTSPVTSTVQMIGEDEPRGTEATPAAPAAPEATPLLVDLSLR